MYSVLGSNSGHMSASTSQSSNAGTPQRNTRRPEGNGRPRQPPPQHPPTEQIVSSWADDNISDAEIVAISDASIPLGIGLAPLYPESIQSRRDILHDAIHDARIRSDTPPPSARNAHNVSRDVAIGAKRGNDGVLEQNTEHESYADKASKYPWEDANKRRRRGSSGDPFALHGSRSTPQKDLFVMDLDYSRCDKPEDLEMRVRHHCRKRGVVISYVKAFQLLSNCARANCKVSVNEHDADLVLSDDFWPEYASVRDWLPRPQYNAANKDENGYADGLGLE